MNHASSSSLSSSRTIQLLPKEVIERIKAGEVVQRPTAAVKELMENALDAGATEIIVTVSSDGLREISVSDNGCGISSNDLALAVQRHTTSKLQSVQDLASLQSFGFRGEALASILHATGRVHIVSRTREHAVAFQQTFTSLPKHTSTSSSSSSSSSSFKQTPCARKPGTTVTLYDLFATMKQRQKLTNDYPSILQLIQNYAILYASKGISFVCQKLKKSQPDLNTGSILVKQQNTQELLLQTSQLESMETNNNPTLPSTTTITLQQFEITKKVIALIHGSHLLESLVPFQSKHDGNCSSSSSSSSASDMLPKQKIATKNKNKNMNSPNNNNDLNLSLLADMTGIPLLATTQPIEKETNVEDEVCSFQVWGLFTKPLSNSQQQQQRLSLNMILFINGRLVECTSLKKRIEELYSTGKHLIFLAIDVPPHHVDVNIHPTKKQVALLFQNEIVEHISTTISSTMKGLNHNFIMSQEMRCISQSSQSNHNKRSPTSDSETINTSTSSQETENITPTTVVMNPYSKKPLSAKRIRTHYTDPRGAMEPFLSQESIHEPNCPLLSPSASSQLDLSQPGAFANAARQCTCRQIIHVPRQPMLRPKKILPTDCTYKSIAQLRQELLKPNDHSMKLRTAYYVGLVTQFRSLIQCGKELVLLNHHQAAIELFYQIALLRFGGGAAVASLAKPIDITTAIQSELELKGDPSASLAEEAAIKIWEHAEMLQEYFSIILAQDSNERVVLKGLPILLDGWEPMAHGLPLFLLRLATKVNWSEEKPCFHDLCHELGWFYAELPSKQDDISSFVRHTLFPALSTLLIPTCSFVRDEGMITVTSLDKLYRIFERC